MKFTLYTADCTGNETNCLYPHKAVISGPEDLAAAVSHDHVAPPIKIITGPTTISSQQTPLCGIAIMTRQTTRMNG